MATPTGLQQPTPERFFSTLQGYQRSAAMKAALELEVFTAIGEGATTASAVAKRVKASERGVRILCDYLTVENFLTKSGDAYGLTAESAAFLDKRSKTYVGTAADFLLDAKALESLERLTEFVRDGGRREDESSMIANNPLWTKFARGMMPMIFPGAQAVAALVQLPHLRETKIIDIAASHGLFGISVAQRYPNAHVTAVDWQIVLEVTKENATKFGIADRFSALPGSAFDVDFGPDNDLILIPNFLHHFDIPTCEKFLKKCYAALRSEGQVAIVDFVPNADRVSPPIPAQFSMTMLAGTERGDAYTEAEYRSMLKNSGFAEAQFSPLVGLPQTLITARK